MPELRNERGAFGTRRTARRRRAAYDASVTLVDDFGNAVGYLDADRAHHGADTLHLAMGVFLVDAFGRVLVTRRAPQLPVYPGAWTTTIKAHIGPMETAVDAARRTVAYELGMLLVGLRMVVPTFRYHAEQPLVDGLFVEDELCPVFVGRARGDITLNRQLLAAAAWFPWPTFRDDVLFGRRG